MTGEVTRCAADQGAFDAAFGLGGRRERGKRKRDGSQSKQLRHRALRLSEASAQEHAAGQTVPSGRRRSAAKFSLRLVPRAEEIKEASGPRRGALCLRHGTIANIVASFVHSFR